MGKVSVDVSMSLDGFIAGPNDGIGNALGDGGDQLHQWLSDEKSWRESHEGVDAEMLEQGIKNAGAVIIGRRMFDFSEKLWGDIPPFHMPVFVVTHRPHETIVKADTSYIFVTDGIESTLQQAKAAAGEKDVAIAGANIIQQYIKAGLVDELLIHLVPILLSDGTRLLENIGEKQLEQIGMAASPGATHLKYKVVK